MNLQSKTKMNNGLSIPWLGLGTFKLENGKQAYDAVRSALEFGYRHIDTAKIYGNEESVGKAICDSGIPREDIFVTTKLWTKDMAAKNEQGALKESLRVLNLDYIDLYLIHWPVKNRFVDSYLALESCVKDGLVRSLGVSNYHQNHLDALLAECSVKPVINQLECHPYLTQTELAEYCAAREILFEQWSPLGRGAVLSDPVIVKIAEDTGKSPAQIALRWGLQRGFINIPKSSGIDRIRENADIFDFELSPEQMSEIFTLNKGKRVGPDPDNFDF